MRDWHIKGAFIPHLITDSGTRYYLQEQLNHFLGIKGIDTKNKKYWILQSHFTSKKDDFGRQIENVKTYMFAKGYAVDLITDIKSGINYNKRGLTQLIDMITNSQVERLIIPYNDR